MNLVNVFVATLVLLVQATMAALGLLLGLAVFMTLLAILIAAMVRATFSCG